MTQKTRGPAARTETSDELSDEELDRQEVAQLPDREAMSIISTPIAMEPPIPIQDPQPNLLK